jgi:hypothetical protein
MRARSAIARLTIVSGTAFADSFAAWRADGIFDGVQVERRDVPGSSFDELRLTVMSSSRLQRLCDAIYPTKFPPRLERRFKKQELLRETQTERWTYEQISFPPCRFRPRLRHSCETRTVRIERPLSRVLPNGGRPVPSARARVRANPPSSAVTGTCSPWPRVK